MINFDVNILSRQILALAPDAILFADRDGVIRLWNQGAERIFGYSTEQALGQSLDLIIPEKLRGRHWEGYHQTMATGATGYGTALLSVPAMRQDGTRLSTEFAIVLLQDRDGLPLGVAAIMRDVTEKREQERLLRDRLAQLETAPAG